jgi:hypothetical protein
MKELFFTYVIPISIVIIGIYLSFWTDIIKDSSNNTNKPYSFARTQLMWWTLIIISTYCSYYGLNNALHGINASSLILLGISIGTTTLSKIIDNTDINNNIVRHQDLNTTKSFLINILSDENGISVHRFQAFIFNIIFGLIFITEFITTEKFAEFGQLELTLMGISSSAYVGLKMNENKKHKGKNKKTL